METSRTHRRAGRALLLVGIGLLTCATLAGLPGAPSRAFAEDEDVHLYVRLMDGKDELVPMQGITFTEKYGTTIDLAKYKCADKASAVWIRAGPTYQPGDHIQLRDEAGAQGGTVAMCIDPHVSWGAPSTLEKPSGIYWRVYKLDTPYFRFNDRAGELRFVINPRKAEEGKSKYRVRLALYAAATDEQDTVPNYSEYTRYVVLYDWQQKGSHGRIDLRRWKLPKELVFIRADAGHGLVVSNDLNHVILYESDDPKCAEKVLDLGTLRSAALHSSITWTLKDHMTFKPTFLSFRLANPGK